MPFVRGESLRARIEPGSGCRSPSAVGILRDVARALAYAHARRRRPSRHQAGQHAALVRHRGRHGLRHRQGALGVAHRRADGTTGALTQIGHVARHAGVHGARAGGGRPRVDHRADLYAWGVLAYELLAGRHPFTGRTTAQPLIAAHVSEAPPPLSVVAPDVPSISRRSSWRVSRSHRARGRATRARCCGARADRRAAVAPAARHGAPGTLVGAVARRGGGGWRTRSRRSRVAPARRRARKRCTRDNGAPVREPERRLGEHVLQRRHDGGDARRAGARASVPRVIARDDVLYKGKHEDPVSRRGEDGRRRGALWQRAACGGSTEGRGRAGARARMGNGLWAETYERSTSDVFLIQEEIARAIASSLRITLAPRAEPRRVAPASHDAYLRARQLASSERRSRRHATIGGGGDRAPGAGGRRRQHLRAWLGAARARLYSARRVRVGPDGPREGEAEHSPGGAARSDERRRHPLARRHPAPLRLELGGVRARVPSSAGAGPAVGPGAPRVSACSSARCGAAKKPSGRWRAPTRWNGGRRQTRPDCARPS